MTNILIEGYSHIPSFDLTVKDLERFRKVLQINVRSKLTRHISSSDILWSDILLTVRPNNPLSRYLARKAQKAGKKVIVLLDDDLMEYNATGINWVDNIGRNALKDVLDLSSAMITTSVYLGEKYKSKYGVNAIFSDTVVDEEEIKPPLPNDSGEIKIVYAAAASHRVFFEKLMYPILNDLYNKYEDSISLTLIGPQIDTSAIKLKVDYVPSMPMDEYQNYMSTHHFDIGIAPLFNVEFCKSKYFNKYLEYTKNNICGIYSNVMPYNGIIKNGINGFLADEQPEQWFKYLTTAIDSPEKRINCVKNAQQELLTRFSLNSVAKNIVEQYPLFVEFKSPRSGKVRVGPIFLYFLLFELFRRLMSRVASI